MAACLLLFTSCNEKQDNLLSDDEINNLIKIKQLSTENLRNSHKAWRIVNVHDNTHYVTGDFSFESSLASFTYNKNTNKSIAYKYVATDGPWQSNPMAFTSAHKDKYYKILSSEDFVFIK
ncbi:MAG: hypothetical protein Q4F97_11510 [Bacteroidales bacterium]|nr:hypothetical protein [Bacteroidales bacterium]